jgi:uncharacterized protein (DUF302 family)
MIKNLLALIGTLVVAGLIFAFAKFGGTITGATKLDPQAMGLYMKMMGDVVATGSSSQAMVRKVQVNDGIEPDDIVEVMKDVAEEEDMQMVGDTKMFDGSLDEDGKKTKYTRILSFCSRSIAKKFLAFDPTFGAFMPCRIMIREDDNGKLWLYTMAMELMIHGGNPLPDNMLKSANHVRDTMYKAMDAGATGDDLKIFS